jgi:Mg-chelatase subunit ChlD
MNPDAPLPPPDAREARLAALLHGELPAAEAEALRAEIAADPALAALFRRLSLAHELARETIRSPEPKELSKPEPIQLSPERRAALLAKFKETPANVMPLPAPARKAWPDRRELLALAAMLVAVITAAGAMLPALAKAKSKSSRVAALQAARMAELESRRASEVAERPADVPLPAAANPAGVLVPDTGLAGRELAEVPAKPAGTSQTGPVLTRRNGRVPQSAARGGVEVTSLAPPRGAVDSSRRLLGEELAVKQQVAEVREDHSALEAGPNLNSATAVHDTGVQAPAVDFFGRAAAPARGQGVGPGGGDIAGTRWFFRQSQASQGGAEGRPADGFARFDDQAQTVAGVGGATLGGGFGGQANQLNFGGIAAQTPPPAPAPAGVVAADAATVAFPVPEVEANARELSSAPARPAVGREVETLSRTAGRKDSAGRTSDVAAHAGAAPSEPLIAAVGDSTVAVARGVNGPVLNSPAALDFREKEARLQEGKAEILADVAAAVPPTEEMDHLAVASGSRAQVALGLAVTQAPALQADKKSGAEPVVKRFAKYKADSAAAELKEFEKLAELEAGQTLAMAGKPVSVRSYYSEMVTNAAAPASGEAQVLGRMFKGVEAARSRVAANSVTEPRWLAVLERDGDRPLPKLAPGGPEPQPDVLTADDSFSTFSLNVSDVSFKLAAAALEKGQMPEPATVRTEEFINAFDYRDPEPAGAAPIAFTWERARYPFAHDRDLVRFSVKTAASGRQSGRPLNLVLLLDNSGSMERTDRIRVRQECLRVLAAQLQPEDRVSVVAFARTPRLWVDGLAGAQAAELPGRVGELTPDGGTNLEEALRTAYQTAARHFAANGVNRVILLTDGAANLGDVQPESLKRQVEMNRQQGIALDCFGIGWEGLNDELLEVLSRNGDGRYGFVNTAEAAQSEFAGQLVGALQIAASDVKVQVEWNPKRVTAYRQLGYAKHQLTKEQFRDNTVDAAEIAAAEAGNALYTVQVNPAGEGPLGTVRVRFKVPGSGDYREHEWPLNYDGTARPLDQAGPALRLAGSASAFSEWLVSSPYAAEVTPDRLLELLNGVADTYAADPRPKQFEQMLRQAKSVSGR